MADLTPKQEKFAQKYIETGCAAEAYRLAYDAENMKAGVIHVKACELLKNGKVAVRVAELQAQHRKRHEITIDRIKEQYGRLAFSDIRKAYDEDGNLKSVHDLDDETAAAITSIDVDHLKGYGGIDEEQEPQPHGGSLQRKRGIAGRVSKVRLADKKAALDSLAKHFGMFSDAPAVTVNMPLTEKDRELLAEYAARK